MQKPKACNGLSAFNMHLEELQRCSDNYVNQQKERDQDNGKESNKVAKYNMVLLI